MNTQRTKVEFLMYVTLIILEFNICFMTLVAKLLRMGNGFKKTNDLFCLSVYCNAIFICQRLSYISTCFFLLSH